MHANDGLHLVDGLLVAQANVDAVVATIRAAPNATVARAALEASFDLSTEQSDAILSMQLRRLTGLERTSLEEEGSRLRATRAELNELLDERPKLVALISAELLGLKEAHATPRRTKIGRAADADLTEEDLTANEQ